jgi:phosphatidylinositol dimannoside acyltransferase
MIGDGERMTPAERRAYWTLRAAEWIGMHVPRSVGMRLAVLYQRVYFARSVRERETAAANLARVLGHPPDAPIVRQAARECFLLYGRYWYETFALRTMPPDEVRRRFTVDGIEHVDKALADGKGIVLALPHMGNWDAAGHWLCLQGYRMTAVAEELRPRPVFELFLRHRRALGMGIVPLSEGGRVAETLVRLLSENHIITLVADRDLSGRGVQVEMFGAPRLLPAGPALLSLSTGAPMCASAVFTTPEGWHTVIEAPIEIERTGTTRADVKEMTRILASRFERAIASAPTDWHMFQAAWDGE